MQPFDSDLQRTLQTTYRHQATYSSQNREQDFIQCRSQSTFHPPCSEYNGHCAKHPSSCADRTAPSIHCSHRPFTSPSTLHPAMHKAFNAHRTPSVHCTQTLIHRRALTHRNFYPEERLHTEECDIQELLDRRASTEKLLHRKLFTHTASPQSIVHAQEIFQRRALNTGAFVHKSL